jgi:hypothetical protein
VPLIGRDAERDHHILEHREVGKYLRNLERSMDTEAHHLARPEARNIAPVVANGADVGLEITGHHIDESGLPGAVGADHADPLAGLDRDRDVIGGDHRAEALAERFRGQNGGHG